MADFQIVSANLKDKRGIDCFCCCFSPRNCELRVETCLPSRSDHYSRLNFNFISEKMWESTSYDNAGGFYEQNSSQATATPGGGEKKKRANNVVATFANTVLNCGKYLLSKTQNPDLTLKNVLIG